MTNREKVDYVNQRLMEDVLLALAEEASEVSQAALKMYRAVDGKNPTPVSPDTAYKHLIEEMEDTLLCWSVLRQCGQKEDTLLWGCCLTLYQNQKLDRWVKRLKEAEDHVEDKP